MRSSTSRSTRCACATTAAPTGVRITCRFDALDQRHIQFVFELADLRRQRRLTDEARFGGAAEMQMLGQRDQIAQVAQIHQSRQGSTMIFACASGTAEVAERTGDAADTDLAGDQRIGDQLTFRDQRQRLRELLHRVTEHELQLISLVMPSSGRI